MHSDRLLHIRRVSGKKQQAQAAQLSPQQRLCRGAAGLLPQHSVPLLLQAVAAAAAADGGVSNKYLPLQRTEILARQAGKGYLF